jgi:hypothetical protein
VEIARTGSKRATVTWSIANIANPLPLPYQGKMGTLSEVTPQLQEVARVGERDTSPEPSIQPLFEPDQTTRTFAPIIMEIQLVPLSGGYFFYPSDAFPVNQEFIVFKDMEESVLKRSNSSRLECLALDYKWLKCGRKPLEWIGLFSGMPCLTEVKFYYGKNKKIHDMVNSKFQSENKAASVLTNGIIEDWRKGLRMAVTDHYQVHSKWGIEAWSREPPEITVWKPVDY